MLKKIFWFATVVVVLVVLAGAGALYWFVALNPGDKIRPENIHSILGKESPVFYSDGVTRLGVFFDEAHRQYVPYEKIPVNFINALVASEDNIFFSHFGFDIVGIVRAAIKNIQSGRIVQGGSTLTQQTAKNLFKRENRSIKAKLKELLYALRLEYHYSKQQIFEFYANQFYVYGNGHGLGVAARYYFDKKPDELSLLQCAYIAGSVKRPNYYNPFIKKGEEATKKALERGRGRVDYVLTNMLELGMISRYQHGVASFNDIGFKQGRVGFPLDYVMDMVKDAASSTEVAEALAEHNIANVATSGVRIITTVDKGLQDQALYSLRHDLSRLDVRLRGYERQEVQAELQKLDYAGDAEVETGAFRLGVIETVEGDGASPVVKVDLGGRFGLGVIGKSGISRLVEARVKWQKNPWTQAAKSDYSAFVGQLRQGDKVWVSVRGKKENGLFELDLEKFPQINGGALVLKDGLIKAVAGGVENRFYNRAIYARRTMGSSFKPFVFAAAHQLGWNTTDTLRNRRDVFVFYNQPYFPRPDHHSPFDEVSLSWAGVKSENVASVWLLAHLCDRLTSEQFSEVASHVGLAPRVVDGEEEPYSRFRNRIRDSNGIVLNDGVLRKAAYTLALKNIETDLIFAGRDLEYQRLQNMHYGLGFAEFREAVETKLRKNRANLGSGEREELQLRLKILSQSFLQLEEKRRQFERFRQQYQVQQQALDFGYTPSQSSGDTGALESKGRLYYDTFAKDYRFLEDASASGGMIPVSTLKLGDILGGLDAADRQRFWNNVYLDGSISVETFDLMQQQIDREMTSLQKKQPYSMEVLEHVGDYRILVGLKYV
ncbi:MAG TPA: transglycosylase domain-containing protein, partial [Desulfopila sp.]|nr:transglycosylase domain-containing protein [Desulfopila sp.]